MTKRCVLFDMDGTLFDSGIDFLAPINKPAKKEACGSGNTLFNFKVK